MFEALVRKVRYVRDVPLELTEKALMEGVIGSGSVVGVEIEPLGESEPVLVEVRISDDEQSELLKPGLKVPLVGEESVLRLSENWRDYLLRPYHRRTQGAENASKGGYKTNAGFF